MINPELVETLLDTLQDEPERQRAVSHRLLELNPELVQESTSRLAKVDTLARLCALRMGRALTAEERGVL